MGKVGMGKMGMGEIGMGRIGMGKIGIGKNWNRNNWYGKYLNGKNWNWENIRMEKPEWKKSGKNVNTWINMWRSEAKSSGIRTMINGETGNSNNCWITEIIIIIIIITIITIIIKIIIIIIIIIIIMVVKISAVTVDQGETIHLLKYLSVSFQIWNLFQALRFFKPKCWNRFHIWRDQAALYWMKHLQKIISIEGIPGSNPQMNPFPL